MLLSLVLSIACVLPVNASISVGVPTLSFTNQSLLENAQHEAGLNGANMEYAMMPTTLWTSLNAHLPSGNLVARAVLFDFPGAGIPMTLGLTYNSLHKDLNLGLGKGWMSDLNSSAMRDPLSNVIRYVSPTGTLLEFIYSPAENKYLNPPGFSGQAIYHSNGNISVIDLNLQTQSFNTLGQLIEVKKCSGGSYTVDYNNEGQAILMTDPISERSIQLEWSPSGILETIIDPMDHEWKLGFSQDYQQLVSLQQPEVPETEIAKTFFEYDSQSYLTKQTTFGGYEISLSYHSSGSSVGKISELSDANNTTSFDYNDSIQNYASQTTLTNAEGQATQYFIGSNSGQIERIKQTIDQEDIESIYSYDSFGWLSSVTDPQGGVYLISRNASGRVTSLTYPPASTGQASYSEEWIYDHPSIEGKLIQQREKLTSTLWASTYYFYEDQDAPCLPSKITNPDGIIEFFDYNQQGQKLSHILDPTGMNRSSQNTYAQNGNLTLSIDPEGNERTYQYNTNGFRVLELLFQGASTLGQAQKSISTDRLFNGNPIAIGENLSNIGNEYVWNPDGSLVCELTTDDCGNVCYDYENNSSNQGPIFTMQHLKPWSDEYLPIPPKQPGIVDPTPPFTPPPHKITYNDNEIFLYSYNKIGQVTEFVNPLGQSTTYTYDSIGRVLSEEAYNGKVTEFTFNKLNRVLTRTVSGEGTWTYTRDDLGRTLLLNHPSKGLIQYAYSLRGDLLSDENGTYSYDMMGRKVSAQYSGGGTDQWTYRADSNVSSRNGIALEHNQMGLLSKWSDGTNQAIIQYRSSVGLPTTITGSGNHSSYSFQYDVHHRMTQAQDTSKQIGSFQYQWNAENRLQTLSSPGQIVQDNYYANNKRSQSTLKKGNNTLYSANATLDSKLQLSSVSYTQAPSFQEGYSFSYDTLQRLQSINTTSNNQTVSYSYSPTHGKVTSIQYSNKGTYTINRNNQGFIQSVSHPDLNNETYTYNTKGLLESISLPSNNTISFSWDSKNRVSQISTMEMQNQVNYSLNYNAIGKLSGLSKSVQGFTVESWQFVNGIKGLEYASRSNMGFQDLSLNFSRDLLGRALSITYQQAGGYNGELIPHFDYFGNLAQITDLNGNLLASFQYDINTQKRIQEWNPQQLQLPFNGYASTFSLSSLFSNNPISITLPDHNGKFILGTQWGVVGGKNYEILIYPYPDEKDITWDCDCGGWDKKEGKISEKDRQEIKNRLRKRGYAEKDLNGMIGEMEDTINECCDEKTKGIDDEGRELVGIDATLRFAIDDDLNDWSILCKKLPE